MRIIIIMRSFLSSIFFCYKFGSIRISITILSRYEEYFLDSMEMCIYFVLFCRFFPLNFSVSLQREQKDSTPLNVLWIDTVLLHSTVQTYTMSVVFVARMMMLYSYACVCKSVYVTNQLNLDTTPTVHRSCVDANELFAMVLLLPPPLLLLPLLSLTASSSTTFRFTFPLFSFSCMFCAVCSHIFFFVVVVVFFFWLASMQTRWKICTSRMWPYTSIRFVHVCVRSLHSMEWSLLYSTRS